MACIPPGSPLTSRANALLMHLLSKPNLLAGWKRRGAAALVLVSRMEALQMQRLAPHQSCNRNLARALSCVRPANKKLPSTSMPLLLTLPSGIL